MDQLLLEAERDFILEDIEDTNAEIYTNAIEIEALLRQVSNNEL